MSVRRGIVRLDGQRVGVIAETDGGTAFTYDDAWLARPDAQPISLTLPLQHQPFETPTLHPFFENLLPEGWLLSIATSRLKIPRDDGFGLLLAMCADCVGAVEIAIDPEPTG
ncbi:MAG: HipA N-terminal domain-containing protein [Chloroflexota bacterium]